ncbi:MAG: lasso peptide biosynthesis B2 protein [Allopontixanthobacter sediminis]
MDLNRKGLAWRVLDEQFIFLDIPNDRYFRLSDDDNRVCLKQLERSSLERWHQPADLARPADWTAPKLSSPAIHQDIFRLAGVARALWTQRRVEARLSKHSLALVLSQLRGVVERKSSSNAKISEEGLKCIGAFEDARLLRTAADRCLSRSIALAACLAGHGDRARIVLGVHSPPFAAHCWTQHGDTVLNDSVEEVLRYQPILVV